MKQPALNHGRRILLRRMGGAAALSAVAPSLWLTACGDSVDGLVSEKIRRPADHGILDVDLRLRAGPGTAPILPGARSEVWRYTSELQEGPKDTLSPMDESYLGPVIRLRRGQRVRVHVENGLPENTTVHWHGLHVPPEVDGQPRFPIKPGETVPVAFDVVDRPGLYWYHPHPHGPNGGRVGFQTYAGLAGPLVVEDEAEQALGLPSGEQEKILILQDRSFAGDNELVYIGGGMGSMMTRMQGFLGDQVLVNGRPDYRLDVATQPYRLRILNGSNARIYKLAWSDGRPVTVLGTGGGLLAAPQQRPYVVLAPAQRVDLWVSFADAEPGTEVQLISETYPSGVMQGMMGRAGLPPGGRVSLLTARVTHKGRSSQVLPQHLSSDLPAPAVTHDTPVRRFNLSMRMMRGFAINGRQFEGATVADDEIVRLGQTEIWEFFNDSMMPHPMHVHGLQFSVVERQTSGRRYGDGLSAGIVDAGLHDTVLVLPGERVRIALTFTDFTGLYLYHCHNMEHEDNGMMRYYRVQA